MAIVTCPPDVDELAEDYCLHRLDRETAESFEDHYLACPACAQAASDTLNFIAAFRRIEATGDKSEPERKFQ